MKRMMWAAALAAATWMASAAWAQVPPGIDQDKVMRDTRQLMRGIEEKQALADEFAESMLDEMSPAERRAFLRERKKRKGNKIGLPKATPVDLSGMRTDRSGEKEPAVTLAVKRERMTKALREHLVRTAKLERIAEVAKARPDAKLERRAKAMLRQEARRYAGLSLRLQALEVKP